MNFGFRLGSHPQDIFIMYSICKYSKSPPQKIKNLKRKCSQAFWIRDTQPVSPENLSKFLGPTPDPLNQKLWGETSNLWFNKPSRWLWCKLKSENNCSELSVILIFKEMLFFIHYNPETQADYVHWLLISFGREETVILVTLIFCSEATVVFHTFSIGSFLKNENELKVFTVYVI